MVEIVFPISLDVGDHLPTCAAEVSGVPKSSMLTPSTQSFLKTTAPNGYATKVHGMLTSAGEAGDADLGISLGTVL